MTTLIIGVVYYLEFSTREIFNFVETAIINTREKKIEKKIILEFLGIFLEMARN